MIEDIIIDTNILIYLENENYQYHTYCVECIELVKNSAVLLCVDIGFNLDRNLNTSHIGGEYTNHLPIGSEGFTFILALIQQERISFISKDVDNKTRQLINRSGIKNADKHFVKVAFNSKSKILVTDEHEDFTITSNIAKYKKGGRRKMFKDELGVSIPHSWEITPVMFQNK